MSTNNKIRICFLLLFFTLISCDGTLGGFNIISFPVSKKKIEIAIDNIYSKYPEYKIPNKYQDYNKWDYWGANSLDTHTFYFRESPEEIYYISFIGEEETLKDTTHIDIAIRSVFVGRKMKWLKQENFSKEEESRIQTRFKTEIIAKLEKYTKSKAKYLGN